MPAALSSDDARHWAMLTRAAFAARRTEIDELNVFPVPDGDTGTNLYLTMDRALKDVVEAHAEEGILGSATLVDECRTLSRAVLLSARGNSGVITSQIIGGLCEVVMEEEAEVLDASGLMRALTRGAELARRSVSRPIEGTILTVMDAAAAAARDAADGDGALEDVTRAAVHAAEQALSRTPEQLEVLARAGVVDAGGAGCVLMLEALHRAVSGSWTSESDELLSGGPGLRPRAEWHPGRSAEPAKSPIETPRQVHSESELDHYGNENGPAYEVVFLLEQTTPSKVGELRARLDCLGDSLVVVGGPDVWKVHVHVDDVGRAIEAGVEIGRPRDIRVTHFATQAAGQQQHHIELGVVACAAGPGLVSLMTEAGAVVVRSAPGNRASAGELLEAIIGTRADSVIILPNDKDTRMAAETAANAAEDDGIVTHVVPARTVVQGLAALAVHDPERSMHDNSVAMNSAAAATRHGAVSIAYKEALTWAGVCHPGDILGIVDGDIAILGDTLLETAGEVLGRLLAPGGELVTLVTGVDADVALVSGVAGHLRRTHPEVEIVSIDGGQPIYPLLIGVE